MAIKQIQWGIIGCGDVTEIKSGPAFNKVADSRLVAVMRRNAEKAKDYALRHGVPKWYNDAEHLINDPEINAIYVATPPLQHEAYTIAALKAGKPVYVEKPMAINKEAAKNMANAASATGTKLSIAHYRREQPLFKKIKSLIDTKVIGDVRLVNLQCFQPNKSSRIARTEDNWRIDPGVSGGGLFYDLAPHQLDLMIYFFGSAMEAKGISLNTGAYYEADDTTSGTVLFQNNVLFTGTWCFAVPAEELKDRCEIIGTKGKISFSVFEQNPVVVSGDGRTEELKFDPLPHVQQPMIAAVADYFLGKADRNPCTAEEGVEVMTLMEMLTKR
jgi:predicted dehydrogenase